MTKWKMPDWMEPFRESILNTGGNEVEDLVNDRSTVFENAPRALLAFAVHYQVSLLTALHKAGRI